MQRMSNGRVRRTETEWRELLARFEQSGLGMDAFCEREKVASSSFQRWQRKLEAMGSTDGFVPVSPAATTSEGWTLEITLPNGCQLRFQG